MKGGRSDEAYKNGCFVGRDCGHCWFASVWVQGTIAAQSNEASLPADVGDLSNAATVEVKDSTGAVVLTGHFVEAPEDDDDVERKGDPHRKRYHGNGKR